MAGTDKRGEERKTAERMYLESKGTIVLAELAGKLGVSASKIRKWKTLDQWDQKLNANKPQPRKPKKKQVERSTGRKVERSTCNAEPTKRNKGGQQGNKNSLKHGAYSLANWGILDDEEEDFLAEIPDETETQLMQEIQMYSVRERRIMKAINKYRDMANGNKPYSVYMMSQTRNESKRKFKTPEEEQEYEQTVRDRIDNGDRLPGDPYQLQTTTGNTDDMILRMEKELSTVQRSKTAAINALREYRKEKAELEGSGESRTTQVWVDMVSEGENTDG